jgi:hypothetical protein
VLGNNAVECCRRGGMAARLEVRACCLDAAARAGARFGIELTDLLRIQRSFECGVSLPDAGVPVMGREQCTGGRRSEIGRGADAAKCGLRQTSKGWMRASC